MNEGEPKPKSRMDILNEKMVVEAEQKLAAMDEKALAAVPEQALESERAELLQKKAVEDGHRTTAHFKSMDVSRLQPYDLWNSLRANTGDFDGPEGNAIFNQIRTDVFSMLGRLERGGRGSQESRKELYAYLGNLLSDHNNKIDP